MQVQHESKIPFTAFATASNIIHDNIHQNFMWQTSVFDPEWVIGKITFYWISKKYIIFTFLTGKPVLFRGKSKLFYNIFGKIHFSL